MPWWSWFAIAVFIGLLQPVIIQMTLNLASVMGDMPASTVLHFVGAIAGTVFVVCGLRGGTGEWASLPWWAWLGGALGVCCLWLLNATIPKLGIASTFATVVASQLVASLIVERYSLLGAEFRPIQWQHLIGVVLLSVGAYMVSLRD